mgnify:CR=1 FL=1
MAIVTVITLVVVGQGVEIVPAARPDSAGVVVACC